MTLLNFMINLGYFSLLTYDVYFHLSTAADPKKSHCPLCHQNIATGDSSWTHHLMSMAADACKQNPRRVAAHNKAKNKATAGGKGAPAVKGKGTKAGRK